MKSLPPSPAERERQLRLAGVRALPKNQGKMPDRWPIFLEVVVGGVAWCARDELINKLKNRGRIHASDAELVEEVVLSRRFEITTGRQDLKLTLVTPKELGVNESVSLQDIYKKAAEFDLALLPIDTGPQTILQVHTNWTTRNSIVVASAPVVLKEGRRFIFDLSSFKLRVVNGEPGHYWEPTQPFLFRRL